MGKGPYMVQLQPMPGFTALFCERILVLATSLIASPDPATGGGGNVAGTHMARPLEATRLLRTSPIPASPFFAMYPIPAPELSRRGSARRAAPSSHTTVRTVPYTAVQERSPLGESLWTSFHRLINPN